MTTWLRSQIQLTALRRVLFIDRTSGVYVITVRGAQETLGGMLAFARVRGLRLTSKEPCMGMATHMLWNDDPGDGKNSVAFDITTEEAHRLADWLGIDMPTPLALVMQAAG